MRLFKYVSRLIIILAVFACAFAHNWLMQGSTFILYEQIDKRYFVSQEYISVIPIRLFHIIRDIQKIVN